MILDHRDGHAPSLLEPARGCASYGGYVEDGQGAIKGLHTEVFEAFFGGRGIALTVR
ncbi:hypothetical protein [Streptosporangium sp. NPDC000396]|uniref:hypothetical protein n=1 Tax=Streptosporangium sp. NPDC000396 TaxID=3366185 RepID=UPI00367F7409